MEFVKRHLGILMASTVIVGGTAFVATQQLAAAPADGDTVTLAQDGLGRRSGRRCAGGRR